MKLVKIRFTAWGDKHAAPRSTALQKQLDDWAAREYILQNAAARVQEQRSKADSEALRLEFTALTTELANINVQRQPIIDAETAAAQHAQGAMFQHNKVGTFGYRVFNDAGTEVVVDEWGNELARDAVYSYDIVDDAPTPPEWAKKGRFK